MSKPISIPLGLVFAMLGLFLTVLIAFIPYVVFQSKQMFTLNKAMEIQLAHVIESRNQNGKVLDFQTKIVGKTEQYDNQVSSILENSNIILRSQVKQEMFWHQIKETLSDLKQIISNNTSAMIALRKGP